MGAAIHLVMAAGEKRRLLDAVGGVVAYNNNTGCWINDGGGNLIKIEYQAGWDHREWALALAHFICKQYGVLRGGWDSVGKLEPVDKFIKYRAFDFNIKNSRRFYRSYRIKYPDAAKIHKADADHYRSLQKEYEKAARELIVDTVDNSRMATRGEQ